MGLERSKVVAAALRLLDEVGLDGLTNRRLAQDLGVRGPALYWHFENKRALTDAMAYAVLNEAHSGATIEDNWVDMLAGEARRVRKALLSHRDGARLMAGYRPNAPFGRLINGSVDELRGGSANDGSVEAEENVHMAGLLRALVGAGFEKAEAMSAFLTVGLYTFGWTIDEQAGKDRTGPSSSIDREAAFEFGLSTILAGLQARVEAAKAGRPFAAARVG